MAIRKPNAPLGIDLLYKFDEYMLFCDQVLTIWHVVAARLI